MTGYESAFDTVKLAANASDLWTASYVSPYGPASSQALVVDGDGNVCVAGENTYFCYSEGPAKGCYVDLLIVKYDPDGHQLWTAKNLQWSEPSVQVVGLAIDSTANLYVVANSASSAYSTYSYASSGSNLWAAFPDNGSGPGNGLGLDSKGNVILTGQNAYAFNTSNSYIYYDTTFKLNSLGTTIWRNNYPQNPVGSSAATAIAVDTAGNSYVTGCSSATSVTIKYDQNGNMIWLQRYSSPGGGNAAGNAIAVDNSGNVYVTGYDTTAAGGTEIVTIKYSPVTLQRRSDGTVILQAQGTPGETFDIEASEHLLNWLDLGSALADTNGLIQFDDTNAPNYPARFYYTTPQ